LLAATAPAEAFTMGGGAPIGVTDMLEGEPRLDEGLTLEAGALAQGLSAA